MDRKPFDFKIISDTEPLTSDPFYAWLDANVDRANPFYAWLDANVDRANPVKGRNYILEYLESLGFVVGEDKVTEAQHKVLEYVIETWFRLTPYHTPMTWDECFADGEDFYVKVQLPGGDNPYCRRDITTALKEAVEQAGWICDVTPSTCYFEIIKGRLYAKYHQILGSRFICTIKEG